MNTMKAKRCTDTKRCKFWIVIALALLSVQPVSLLAAEADKAQPEPTVDAHEAKVEFWNREIVTLRGTVAGAGPELRAERAVERIKELPLNTRVADLTILPFKVDDQEGVGFVHEGKVLFYLGASDLDPEYRESLNDVSQRTLQNLDEALSAREAERSWPVIRSALLFTLIGLALLVVVVAAILRSHSRLVGLLRRREPLIHTPLQLLGIDLRPPIDRAVYGILRLAESVLIIIATYSWLTVSLSRFPYTQPWSRKIVGYVLTLLEGWGQSTVRALPGLLAAALIFVITRWIVGLARTFFDQVGSGRLRVSWLDPDIAGATQRIFAGIAWIFAIVLAYPYIPGSGTEAFKGVSVLVGLVISLGSTGIINQVMSGLFVVYSKALKPGEWVLVNDVEGEVLEVGLLAGKVRTPEGQEVTIPNSVLVGTSTRNFTRLGTVDGMMISCTVTIGYDAPWRQVEGLLLLAADRTPNVRKHPKPYVRQRQLGDFYVSYLLVARIGDEKLRFDTLSSLHANIQDAFNEFGVQIMSPHFMVQPANTVVVPDSKWYSPPAISKAKKPDGLGKAQGAGEE